MTICVRPNGTEFYVAGSCPAGTTAKAPASTGDGGGGAVVPASTPSGSSPAPWRPPQGAWVPRPGSTYVDSDGITRPVAPYVNTSTMTGISEASNYNSPAYNYTSPSSNLEGAINAPEMNSGLFAIVAQGRGNGSTANGVFQGYVAESARLNAQGERVTPQQLAYEEAIKNGWITEDGTVTVSPPGGGRSYGGGGGGGVGSLPVDRSAAKRMMDSLATSLLGRTLSDAEFKDYYSEYTQRFAANPAMDIQQDATEAIQTQEDYQEYQVAGKFAQAMQSVIKGAM